MPEDVAPNDSVHTAAPCAKAATGSLLEAGTLAEVGHGQALSRAYVNKIPESDARVLRFLLAFLEAEGLGQTPVFVNGGYVRDLLLGKAPDDLDVSLCLRDGPADITVGGLLDKLPSFAAKEPDLGIMEVKVATILSNESRDKNIDTFKGHFRDASGHKTEVDVMPTIGEETYEEGNRIPVRDQRGTPEQDALRRDLTIGAMFLRATWDNVANCLHLVLIDFYGGVKDLSGGILRAPFPLDKSFEAVRATVLRGEAEQRLAQDLGIDKLSQKEAVQALWWAKVLMDDPLRVCRVLRFVVKLGFSLHDAFWQAVPFVMPALRSKVAGGRKNIEYQKIGGYGYRAALDFFELAFARPFPAVGAVAGGNGLQAHRLAPALFGGSDEKQRSKALHEIRAFDSDLFRTLASTLESAQDAAVLIGGMLAAAIVASDFQVGPDKGANANKGAVAVAEFQLACDGMCVSNTMREAGKAAFEAAAKMAAGTSDACAAGPLEHALAQACGRPVEDICRNLQVWEAFLLSGRTAEWPATNREAVQRLALGMLRHSDPGKADAIEPLVATMSRCRPPVRGGVLCSPGLLDVPPMLRTKTKNLLEVSLRLLGDDSPLASPEDVKRLFEERPGFRAALSGSTWFEADGQTLRQEYRPPKRGRDGGKKKG